MKIKKSKIETKTTKNINIVDIEGLDEDAKHFLENFDNKICTEISFCGNHQEIQVWQGDIDIWLDGFEDQERDQEEKDLKTSLEKVNKLLIELEIDYINCN